MERSTVGQVIADKRHILDRVHWWHTVLMDTPDLTVQEVVRSMREILDRYDPAPPPDEPAGTGETGDARRSRRAADEGSRSPKPAGEKTMQDIRVGDWVTLPKNAQGTAWDSGHVQYIDGKGHLHISFIGRECDPRDGLHSALGYELPNDVGQVWRRFDVVKYSSFEYEGRTIPVTSLEYEWRQLAPSA